MKQINCIAYKKENGKWIEASYKSYDVEKVYKSLCNDLIAKKLNKASYIKSIKRVNNYDGTDSITVFYENDVKRIYTVETNW